MKGEKERSDKERGNEVWHGKVKEKTKCKVKSVTFVVERKDRRQIEKNGKEKIDREIVETK